MMEVRVQDKPTPKRSKLLKPYSVVRHISSGSLYVLLTKDLVEEDTWTYVSVKDSRVYRAGLFSPEYYELSNEKVTLEFENVD